MATRLTTLSIRYASTPVPMPAPAPARIAPPSLRPTRLDPLQVDVLAALIETLPEREG